MSVTNPTVTGYSAFWSTTGDRKAYAPFDNRPPLTGLLGWRSKFEWQVAKIFNKQQMREQRALFTAVLGAAAGGTATATYARVAPPVATNQTVPQTTGVGDLGGLVPIETVTVINRATTAADVAYLKNMFDTSMVMRGLSLQTDLSGNGAGFGGKGSQVGW